MIESIDDPAYNYPEAQGVPSDVEASSFKPSQERNDR